MDPYVIRNMSG